MSDKLNKLPEEKKHFVKVSDIAKELGCDIRHIYYAIRKEYVRSLNLTNSKYVDPDETRDWYNNRNTKRGRKPTRDAGSLEDKFNVKPGVMLHTVVEVQRRVQVVEDVKQQDDNTTIVKLSSDHARKKAPMKGVTYVLSQDLHRSLSSGEVTTVEDNMKVLESLARSFHLQGKEELAEILFNLHEKHSEAPLVLASVEG